MLDNFEHLLPAAPFVADLLTAATQLKVLVTSRAVLNLRGEHRVVVPPLDVPDVADLTTGSGHIAGRSGAPAALCQRAAVRRTGTGGQG